MAKILENLKKVHAAVVADRITNQPSPLGAALNKAAVAAMMGGLGSDAWRQYMAIYADNDDQHTRLSQMIPDEANKAPYLAQLRAYIVSNAVCFPDTNAFVDNQLDDRVDGRQNTADAPVSDVKAAGATLVNKRPTDPILRSIPLRD